MDFLTEKRGSNEFFLCKIKEEELDDFACQMFGANDIPYFLPFSIIHKDDDLWVEYNTSGLRDMESIVTSVITRKRLVSILSGFINAYIEAEDFMLDTEKVLLDREHVYYNRLTETLKLIYLPIKEDTVEDYSSMQYLAQLLKSLRFDARDIELETSVKSIINEIENGNIENLAGLKNIQKNLNLTEDKEIDDNNEKEAFKNQSEGSYSKPSTEDTRNSNLRTASFEIPGNDNANSSEIEVETPVKSKKGFGLNIPGIEIPKLGKKEDKKETKKKAKKTSVPPKSSMSRSGLGFSIPGKEDSNPDESVQEKEAEVEVKEAKISKTENKKKLSFTMPSIPGISKRDNKKEEQIIEKPEPAKSKQSILEVDELVDDTDGTVIGGTLMTSARLTALNGGSSCAIEAASFTIGRSQSSNLVINNSQVSRTHATIEKIDGEYYVIDQKSSNHTYLNGKLLTPNVPVKLSDGDQLRFSKDTYIFNL